MMDCTIEQGEGPQKLCNMGMRTVLHEHPTAPWHAAQSFGKTLESPRH